MIHAYIFSFIFQVGESWRVGPSAIGGLIHQWEIAMWRRAFCLWLSKLVRSASFYHRMDRVPWSTAEYNVEYNVAQKCNEYKKYEKIKNVKNVFWQKHVISEGLAQNW